MYEWDKKKVVGTEKDPQPQKEPELFEDTNDTGKVEPIKKSPVSQEELDDLYKKEHKTGRWWDI